ncbi:PPP1R15A family protein [Megaselia abdita]
MFTGRNNQSPCFGQSNPHTFLGGRSNNFNAYAMPPQSSSSFQSQQRCRKFQTSCHWSGKGNRLNGKPAPTQSSNYYHHHHHNPLPPPQPQPPQHPTQGSFLSGLRDCMNRFIPHNNFSSKFSQKPRNMRDYPVILPSLPLHTTQPQPNIHTIITVTSPIMEAAVGAVMTSLFSAEDFPALSTPKPVASVKELWEEESKKREKKNSNSCRKTRQNKKSANKNNCDLENTDNGFLFIDFDCTKLHFISFSPPKQHPSSSSCFSNRQKTPEEPTPNSCHRLRQRQMSECSDDSFVVCFTDDCADGVLEMSDDDSDDDSSETEGPDFDTESSDDDEDDTEVDEVDGDMKKTDPFALAVCDDSNQLDSGFEDTHCKKRVHFDPKPPKVRVMRVYSYAAQAARIGKWEQIARDRVRFSNRIKLLAQILNPIFDEKHRDKIYKERFQNICDKNTN